MPQNDHNEELLDFLSALDELCITAEELGLPGNYIAGALLARAQNWYLRDDPSDLAGLEELLEHALDNFRARPKWNID